MQVNFIAVAVVRRKTTADAAPNALAVWADARWTGVWCPVSYQHATENHTCYVFVVRHVFARMTSHWIPKDSILKINNSLKLHFYQVYGHSSDGNRDFVYSSACPLPFQEKSSCYGAFNYNEKSGLSCKRLSNVRIVIKPITVCSIPRLALESVQGPNRRHHKETIQVGDWLDITFCNLWPEMKTSLTNTRTYFRDFGCTFFFSDIHKLFDRQGESHLPPWMACYALANALLVNNHMHIAEFLQALRGHEIELGQEEKILRVIKCVLTPWTMCASEGLYWDDVCLSKTVEDQPFPLSFVPTFCKRVFGKDDCEGRASQAQEMKSLLENIFLHAMQHGMQATYKLVYTSRMACQKLQMQASRRMQLVVGCIRMGEVLHNRVVEAQTVVGDANPLAITQPALATTAAVELIGHSFGILLYKGGQTYMMVENTGWQRRFIEGVDRHLTADEMAFLHKFAHVVGTIAQQKNETEFHIAGNVNPALEAKIYQKLYIGHDRLYFSKNTRQYGVTLQEIAKGEYVTKSMEQVLCEMVKGNAWWGPQKDAKTHLDLYLQIQKRLPSIRQAVMTPQKSEQQFEQLMSDWAPLTEKDMEKDDVGGIWFTVNQKKWPCIEQQMLECMSEGMELHTHEFMRSVLVRVKSKSPPFVSSS